MKISKIIQWDMGHRIANHRSICKGLHGHRYKAEICVSGELISKNDISEEGMVMDFSDIKKIAPPKNITIIEIFSANIFIHLLNKWGIVFIIIKKLPNNSIDISFPLCN